MTVKNLKLGQFIKLAQKIGQSVKNRPIIIGLIGPLGAGKTTFVKTLVKALGGRGAKSPSFVITHQYKARGRIIYHLDFYRLAQTKQLQVLGLDEILNGQHLVLIEWVDKFPKIKKVCDIIIKVKINKNGTRNLSFNI